MAVDLESVNLTHVEDVTDIEPPPTIAVSDTEHHFGALGHEGKRLMLELLEATSEEEPFGERVFGRLGLPYTHTAWNEYHLYWADVDNETVVEALEEWNAAR